MAPPRSDSNDGKQKQQQQRDWWAALTESAADQKDVSKAGYKAAFSLSDIMSALQNKNNVKKSSPPNSQSKPFLLHPQSPPASHPSPATATAEEDLLSCLNENKEAAEAEIEVEKDGVFFQGTRRQQQQQGTACGGSRKSDVAGKQCNATNNNSDNSKKNRNKNKNKSKSKSKNSVHPTSRIQQKSIAKSSLSKREIHIFSERQRRQGMTHLYMNLCSILPDSKTKTDRCSILSEAISHIETLQETLKKLMATKSQMTLSLGLLSKRISLPSSNSLSSSSSSSSSSSLSGVAGLSTKSNEAATMKEGSPTTDSFHANAVELEAGYNTDSSNGTPLVDEGDVAVRFCETDAFITVNSGKRKWIWSGIMQILEEHNLDVLTVSLSTSTSTHFHCIHAKVSDACIDGSIVTSSEDVQAKLKALLLVA